MTTALTQEQIDYITSTTNTRGAAYSSAYKFGSTSELGDYLCITVETLDESSGHGNCKKDTAGALDGTVNDAFKDLIYKILAQIERHPI